VSGRVAKAARPGGTALGAISRRRRFTGPSAGGARRRCRSRHRESGRCARRAAGWPLRSSKCRSASRTSSLTERYAPVKARSRNRRRFRETCVTSVAGEGTARAGAYAGPCRQRPNAREPEASRQCTLIPER